MRAGGLAWRVTLVVVMLAYALVGAPVQPAVGSPMTYFNVDDFTINHLAPTVSPVTVPGGLCSSPVNDVNVAVTFTHDYSLDLVWQLRSPAGTLLTLMDDEGEKAAGGSGDVLFDDEAALLAEDVDFTRPGPWLRPEQPLNAFDGLEASGTWDLVVTDQFANDAGTLLQWSLSFNCLEPNGDLPFVAVPNPPLVIPDPGDAQVSVEVFDCVTVTDVDVEVVFQHSNIDDVYLILEHAGQGIFLWDPQRSYDRGAWLHFDDDAATPVQMVGSSKDPHNPWPVGDTIVGPDEPLSIFEGGPGDGTWTLSVHDGTAFDQGELQQFGIDVACEGEPPPPPPGDVDPVVVLAGAGRVQTAVAVSQENFPDPQSASVAVLATEGNFADALAGTPLAVAANGPVLLTPSDQLNTDTADELARLLPGGATVYLLGGQAALSDTLEQAVTDLGFTPRRLAGGSRYDTAAAIAAEVDAVQPISALLIADGNAFQAALVAGAAAPRMGAALLLSNGAQSHPRHRRRAGRPRPGRPQRRQRRRAGLPRPANPQRPSRPRRHVRRGRPGVGHHRRCGPQRRGGGQPRHLPRRPHRRRPHRRARRAAAAHHPTKPVTRSRGLPHRQRRHHRPGLHLRRRRRHRPRRPRHHRHRHQHPTAPMTRSSGALRGWVARAALVALLVGGLVVPAADPAAATPIVVLRNDSPVRIEDQQAQTSPITAEGGLCEGPVNDINVAISWTHDNTGDLLFQLRNPAGTVITLMDNEGGEQEDGNVLLDDEAETRSRSSTRPCPKAGCDRSIS